MRALRPLLRLAIRDARRDRWRSLLVLITVALPVAGLVAAGTLADSGTATAEENATAGFGRGDVIIDVPAPADGGPATDAAMRAAIGELPAGSEVEVQRVLPGYVPAEGTSRPVTIADVDHADDAVSTGQRRLLDGTFPTSADAVAVSSALLRATGADLGDRVTVDPLGEVTVVGVFDVPEQLSREQVLVSTGTLTDARQAYRLVIVALPDGASLADLPDDLAVDGHGLDEAGPSAYIATSREAVLAQRYSAGERAFFILVGGLATVEVALVAGAAFAVSVRRRQRELGLLAATGGTRAHVRRSVLLTGFSVGLAGAVTGVAVGLVGSWLALPVVSRASDRFIDGLRVDAWWLVTAAMLGLAAALVGAWWPARTVARLPVLTALSGRRPTPTRATRGLVTGIVTVAVGVAICIAANLVFAGHPVVFLAGAVAVVLGAGLTSPWLLEQLGRLARFLPAGPRLAVRDAARFRTRNGPIVTAAMAGLAASVTLSAIVTSVDAREASDHTPTLPTSVLLVEDGGIRGAADRIAAAVGVPARPLSTPDGGSVLARPDTERPRDDEGQPFHEWVETAVVDEVTAVALAGEAAAEHLAAGRGVALQTIDGDRIELRPSLEDGTLGEPTATIEVVPPDPGSALETWRLPQVLLPATPQVTSTISGEVGGSGRHLLVFDEPVSDATYATAVRTAASMGADVSVTAERGYVSSYRGFDLLATWVGAALGLAIVAVAIALAAAESRADVRTLAAVGAGRRTRRSLAASRALLLSGLGAVLAVPVGLLPAASLLTTLVGSPPLVMPWRTLGVILVLVPLVATVGATVASGREPTGLTRAA